MRQVYSKLPSDCIGKAMAGKEEMELLDDSNAIKEYICFKTYIVRYSSVVRALRAR